MPDYEALVTKAAKQIAGEGQITLCLYADIEDAGFNVNTVVSAAEELNAFIDCADCSL